jgi:hypothetical protein
MVSECLPVDNSAIKAICYESFKHHCREASQGTWDNRLVHMIMAALEVLPIIGQIIALFELLVSECSKPPADKLPPSPRKMDDVRTPSPQPAAADPAVDAEMSALQARVSAAASPRLSPRNAFPLPAPQPTPNAPPPATPPPAEDAHRRIGEDVGLALAAPSAPGADDSGGWGEAEFIAATGLTREQYDEMRGLARPAPLPQLVSPAAPVAHERDVAPQRGAAPALAQHQPLDPVGAAAAAATLAQYQPLDPASSIAAVPAHYEPLALVSSAAAAGAAPDRYQPDSEEVAAVREMINQTVRRLDRLEGDPIQMIYQPLLEHLHAKGLFADGYFNLVMLDHIPEPLQLDPCFTSFKDCLDIVPAVRFPVSDPTTPEMPSNRYEESWLRDQVARNPNYVSPFSRKPIKAEDIRVNVVQKWLIDKQLVAHSNILMKLVGLGLCSIPSHVYPMISAGFVYAEPPMPAPGAKVGARPAAASASASASASSNGILGAAQSALSWVGGLVRFRS